MIRNILLMYRYWRTIRRAQKVYNDPESKVSELILDNLTIEEFEGVKTLNYIHNFMTASSKQNKKDLKHLYNRLTTT